MAGDLAGHHVANNDALGMAVDFDQVEHFMAVIHFDFTETDLSTEAGIGTEKKLLTGLPPGVKGTETWAPPKDRLAKRPPYSRAKGTPARRTDR